MDTIQFNLYALLTIAMVVILSWFNLDFGPMRKYEMNEGISEEHTAQKDDEGLQDDDLSRVKISSKGKVYDLVIPILSLIVFAVLAMLYVGGYFNGGMTIAKAFGETDAGLALTLAGFGALVVSFILFVPRRVLSFRTFMDGIGIGVKSMVPAFNILILAWTISGVCSKLLGTGEYVGYIVKEVEMPATLIPAIIFLVAGGLAFAMGTSWGTFGILIPIIMTVCQEIAPELLVISLAATLAGSVFGDHCSPISDTTILSSTGARCNHMNHVESQIPYALLVAGCCFIGYVVGGFIPKAWVVLSVSMACLIVAIVILHKKSASKVQIQKQPDEQVEFK